MEPLSVSAYEGRSDKAPTVVSRPRHEANAAVADEMLGMVAHEMRNALHPIRLAAARLGRRCQDEEQLLQLRLVIERQVAHMSQLVGDMLDTCRAETGKLRVESVAVDLARVIAHAVDDYQGCAASREQTLRAHLPARALTVQGDPVRLSQIVGNLLANASKYTPRGGTIEVSVVVKDLALQVTVADNGIGMAAEVLPHVFEPFVQEARAVAFEGTGLGIGLSVVRELVKAHGGSVVARSAGPGLGSEFVVTLPVASSARAARERAQPVAPHRIPSAAPGRLVEQRSGVGVYLSPSRPILTHRR